MKEKVLANVFCSVWSAVTAIHHHHHTVHTIWGKKFITLVWQVNNVLIAGSPIQAWSLIQAGGLSWMGASIRHFTVCTSLLLFVLASAPDITPEKQLGDYMQRINSPEFNPAELPMTAVWQQYPLLVLCCRKHSALRLHQHQSNACFPRVASVHIVRKWMILFCKH